GHDFGDTMHTALQVAGSEQFNESLSDMLAQNRTFFGMNVPLTQRGFTAPPDVIATYNENVNAEFRVQMALLGDQEAAIRNAKQIAFDQTLRKRPPVLWNGKVYFQQHENAPHGNIEEAIRHELTV